MLLYIMLFKVIRVSIEYSVFKKEKGKLKTQNGVPLGVKISVYFRLPNLMPVTMPY